VAAALLDVDGTLVDSNYHHAVAWYRAFREHDVTVPIWRIHRHVGMGGDQLVAAVAGDEVEAGAGDALREAEGRLYGELIDEVAPLPGARELIERLRDRGHTVVLASSGAADDVERYIDMLDVRDLANAWTTSADVEATKPEPDLVAAALEKAQELSGVMVGDTTWDVEAAARADVKTIGVLTGGFSEAELLAAGAVAVFESAAALAASLDSTPLR
jgi:HAD superfamily hydrolase (TIGR01509 family)